MTPIFITGIGTDVGKTVISAIVTEALAGAYWKPVQAGFDQGTDTEWVAARLSHPEAMVVPKEAYRLRMPASPHIAARKENIVIDLDLIHRQFLEIRSGLPATTEYLIIEGAGGAMVPLNESEFVINLVKKLNAKVILVSRNYLGSINHSLLTAAVCKAQGLDVAGWIFNGDPSGYEEEIARWSGIPGRLSIPFTEEPGKAFIAEQARKVRTPLLMLLQSPFERL